MLVLGRCTPLRGLAASTGRRLCSSAQQASKPSTPAIEADKPGFFSRNPEVVFGGIVLALGAFFYRSSVGKSNLAEVKDEVKSRNEIEPVEINLMRSKNNFSVDVFKRLAKKCDEEFSNGTATYEEYNDVLTSIVKGELAGGHYLERVICNLPQVDGEENAGRYSIEDLLIATSLVVKGKTSERMRLMFDMAGRGKRKDDYASSNDGVDAEVRKKEDVVDLTDRLLKTLQIPIDQRVVEVEQYPFLTYKVATADDLVTGAVVELGKKKKGKITIGDTLNYDEFKVVMKHKSVCMWGECHRWKLNR